MRKIGPSTVVGERVESHATLAAINCTLHGKGFCSVRAAGNDVGSASATCAGFLYRRIYATNLVTDHAVKRLAFAWAAKYRRDDTYRDYCYEPHPAMGDESTGLIKVRHEPSEKSGDTRPYTQQAEENAFAVHRDFESRPTDAHIVPGVLPKSAEGLAI